MEKVKDVMHKGDANAVVGDKSCYRDILEEMNAKRLGAVSVVDEQNKLVGLITDGDVRRLLLKTQDSLPELFMKRASVIMRGGSKTISPEMDLDECLHMLEKFSIWVLPVVDVNNVLIGMVHMHTLLKAMAKKAMAKKDMPSLV